MGLLFRKNRKQPGGARRSGTEGNVFTLLLGAIVLSGALSVILYQQLSGPLAASVRITSKNAADAQLLAVSRITLLDATNQPNSGDCDGDTSVEPRVWRDPSGAPAPVNGGLVPLAIGAPVTDPWGTDYGYCVWDVGSFNDPATNQGTPGCGAGVDRLAGRDSPIAGEAETQTVVALISAGPDRQFQTTCYNYADPVVTPAVESDTNLVQTAAGSDDIVRRYTYNEAASSTGLWSLKAGAPGTATIDKDVEVTAGSGSSGVVTAVSLVSNGKTFAEGGLQPGDQTDIDALDCTAGNAGLIRYNTTSNSNNGGLQFCDQNQAWVDTNSGTSPPAPDAFSFTDQTGVALGSTIDSNAVALSGFSGVAYAFCETGCTDIARNGVWTGGGMTGFRSGDTIAIRQTSSASNTTATTATVTVGGTTSGTWSVTTMAVDPCAGSPTVGTVCLAGTVYAGVSPDGSVAMYTTRCDADRTWNGSSCSGTRTLRDWNNGTGGGGMANVCEVSTDIASCGCCGGSAAKGNTGEANTTFLDGNTGHAGHPFAAAQYCHDLSLNGHTDWYLPAFNELGVMVQSNATRTAIGDFLTVAGDGGSIPPYVSSTSLGAALVPTKYWSSGGASGDDGYYMDGSVEDGNGYYYRCVRK